MIQSVEDDFIFVTADSVIAFDARGELGNSVEIPIYIRNIIPLTKVVIPITYSGDLRLAFDSISTTGCRAEGFHEQVHDIGSGFMAIELTQNPAALDPGTGVIVNAYYTILSGMETSQTQIDLNDIGSFHRMFYSDIADYQPEAVNGTIQFPFLCGDTDFSRVINILDVVYLINHIYKSGPDPQPMESADVNNDTRINILDIVYLLNNIYKDGPEPVCPSL